MPRRKPDAASNVEAVTRTIATLRDAGRLSDEHDALVMACKSLAESVDLVPRDAQLWQQYRQALEMLLKAGDGGSDDDSAAFLIAVKTPGVPAAVRNAKKS